MSNNTDDFSAQPRDPITTEEIVGTEPPNHPQPAVDTASQKRPNACTLLPIPLVHSNKRP